MANQAQKSEQQPKTGEVIERPEDSQSVRLSNQLEQMAPRFADALPKHIPVERFMRVVANAIQRNPDLLEADRTSLFLACQEAANDGLMPNGKEGALVIYRTKVKSRDKSGREVELWEERVQWMPMVAGIRKKVRNSDEISDWRCEVVHQQDQFHYELGDRPSLAHIPHEGPGDPGPVVKAYSIAWFKDGTISREVMTRADIDKVRGASKAPNSPAWTVWFDEMAKKAVARRHSKTLPMSTDLDDLMRRDDALYDFEGASDKNQGEAPKRPERADFQRLNSPAIFGLPSGVSDDRSTRQPEPVAATETEKQGKTATEQASATVEGKPAQKEEKASKDKASVVEESTPAQRTYDEVMGRIEDARDPEDLAGDHDIETLIRGIEDKHPNAGLELRQALGARVGRLRQAAEVHAIHTGEAQTADQGAEAEADGFRAFGEKKSIYSAPPQFRAELELLERWKAGWQKAEYAARPKKDPQA